MITIITLLSWALCSAIVFYTTKPKYDKAYTGGYDKVEYLASLILMVVASPLVIVYRIFYGILKQYEI